MTDLLPHTWGSSPGAGTSGTGSAGTGTEAGGEAAAWGGPTGRGTGLVPIPVAEKQIQEEGKQIVAEDRVARGLVSPETNAVGTQLEAVWTVTPRDVRRWPVRPETRREYFAPEGMDENLPGGTCTYQRYSLARVRIVLDRDGSLVSAQVVRSSGSRRLDRQALDLVRRAAPFPPPPSHELRADGTVASVWDVGVRDYSRSSCLFFTRKKLVKDIVLVGEF